MCQNSNVTPSVSVIIAVYKVEEYIAQCCHSLFAQTLKNIEYIFVDDCSPDKSMDIVQSVLSEYPHRKDFVKIIRHPQNMGVSRTREDGVKAATGEYIIHCDPDDWVELDMYEQLYRKAKSDKADLILCDIFYHYTGDPRSYYGKEEPCELSGRSVLASILRAQKPILGGALWNKMIRSKLYKAVEWPDISFCEDWVAMSQILKEPLKVGHISQAYYHYRFSRPGSLTSPQNSRESVDKKNGIIKILYHHLCESDDSELYRYWQAGVPLFMMLAIDSKCKIYTNKEYKQRYRQYRGCIWKDRYYSSEKKILLYLATYNYSIAFALFQSGKRLRAFVRRNR